MLQFTFDFRLILILPTIRLIHNFLCLVLISKLAQLLGGGGGAHSGIFWVGMCRLALQIGTPF